MTDKVNHTRSIARVNFLSTTKWNWPNQALTHGQTVLTVFVMQSEAGQGLNISEQGGGVNKNMPCTAP